MGSIAPTQCQPHRVDRPGVKEAGVAGVCGAGDQCGSDDQSQGPPVGLGATSARDRASPTGLIEWLRALAVTALRFGGGVKTQDEHCWRVAVAALNLSSADEPHAGSHVVVSRVPTEPTGAVPKWGRACALAQPPVDDRALGRHRMGKRRHSAATVFKDTGSRPHTMAAECRVCPTDSCPPPPVAYSFCPLLGSHSLCLEHLHQWSQPSNPTATCVRRVALSLALQKHSQN